MKRNVIIGLPAYNEGRVLPALLAKLEALRPLLDDSMLILVVDDGSTDHTDAILRQYSHYNPDMDYITHTINRGLGEAVNSLLQYAVFRYDPSDILITLDADNTHSPGIIPDLIGKLVGEELDVVIASRFASGGREVGLALHRKLLSRGARLFFRLFFPIANVSDYSSGFRCYSIGFLQRAMTHYEGSIITSGGFECMAEMMARFSQIGVKAGEYPLVLQYDLKETKSKMRIGRTILGYLRLLGKVKFQKKWSKGHTV
ncbi:Undecaprenyl-phosphate mannosyltransferase [Paenibacillus konkukensis]|uniref:Undecaprenyl-phosphate mannosyltransferase n=1 Tax=Paenibacillus konkukensis TaxID=2020716 RepID=A0ABY4RY53_9BACL|nr:glycosyltransferase [Paenibacillus konkukensis]UQZ87609.1 Undecaprenyl-phosphate mannosyltransferase [Paenibacillus konkukensis]